ncbi:uncharacterized protein EKO05_0002124 [Ascochyta rabiei]|uniref:Uncharacterized protein n=1 Tax=Didymella rabiei TaxID=5454 RepID=A0A163C4G4_DIDRA|nr:uncharacterized protein EKO05_0002124 [Ascochyta rabiei]KZM22201.1 hypothetical protein ST47_g6684 [Ascochyta rabiei]UPX11520.1 hypothetical protein EKO05_0002124 [Ascochyta rabiei]
MGLAKRYCVEYVDGTIECFRDGGFWYTEKGQIIKWGILGGLFGIFMLWCIGGYIHARRRLKAGKPLLAYHRLLVSWQERKRYGQAPQNPFPSYATQNAYPNHPPYQQRTDGSWPEAPPLYNGGDAPPGYGAPPGASKANPNQSGGVPMEMPPYGAPMGTGPQQSGVVGGGQGDVEQGGSAEQLPPRPPQKAKAVLKGFTDRFRK